MLNIVILAAGKGSRMKSQLPKVLHPIGGQPLLGHVIQTAKQLSDTPLNIIIGHGSDQVKNYFSDESLQFIEQKQQLGTGHAVQQALPYLDNDATVLILYGDVPLIQKATLEKLINCVSENSLGLLTIKLDDPTGYGRIVRDDSGAVTAIVEQKDAVPEQLAINEVNTGIMAVKAEQLKEWLPALSNTNAQGEYYLTDIIAMAQQENITIATEQPQKAWEVLGINDRRQQAELERIYQMNRVAQLMEEGVTLFDPSRFDCRGNLSVGSDVVIDINCIFKGEVTLGNNVQIGANCIVENSSIADNTVIKDNSILENCEVESDCTIGPFARLRPGTVLKKQAKVGNFVETKKAVIGEGSKVNHLSYVGDATLGREVNIGAGTITCNYDGVNKHQTIIEDRVFVGSNSALVAPVKIEKGATIGAGSTINKNAPEEKLTLTRSPQKTFPNWQRPVKK